MAMIQDAKIGDYVKIGNYPQSAKGIIRPIEWLVLSKEENKMLILSRYGLEARYFIKAKCFDINSNDWKNSEIRKWLNGEFYNKAFDENEKIIINPFDGDNVFLLSKDEVENADYFGNSEARICQPTAYMIANGYNGYCNWWLRSPHSVSYEVYFVAGDGRILDDKVIFEEAVRPALWIKL